MTHQGGNNAQSLVGGRPRFCLLAEYCESRSRGRSGHRRPEELPQYNRTANAWRYSPLDQIDKDIVGKLSVAWIAHGGDVTMGLQETPIVIDGVIYSISSGERWLRWTEKPADALELRAEARSDHQEGAVRAL